MSCEKGLILNLKLGLQVRILVVCFFQLTIGTGLLFKKENTMELNCN